MLKLGGGLLHLKLLTLYDLEGGDYIVAGKLLVESILVFGIQFITDFTDQIETFLLLIVVFAYFFEGKHELVFERVFLLGALLCPL